MKTYRLLRDLPSVKAGAIFKPASALAYFHSDTSRFHVEYCNDIVENSPDWFKEVRPEFEVTINKGTFGTKLFVECAKEIPTEKLPAIKKAIEFVLNENTESILG